MRFLTLLRQSVLLGLTCSLLACTSVPVPDSSAVGLPAELSESSGLLCVNDEFISFNDSGGAPVLYRFNRAGQILSQLRLSVENIDWEAVSSDGQFLYLADSGNNAGKRRSLLIHKIPVDWSSLKAPYKPQTLEIMLPFHGDVTAHQHDLDFEALVYAQQSLWLISKSWASQIPVLYRVDPALKQQQLEQSAVFAAPGFLVTDAVFEQDKQEWWLLGYTDPRKAIWAYLTHSAFEPQLARYDKNLLLLDTKALPTTGQAEGLCIDQDKQLWITEEGRHQRPARLIKTGFSSQ